MGMPHIAMSIVEIAPGVSGYPQLLFDRRNRIELNENFVADRGRARGKLALLRIGVGWVGFAGRFQPLVLQAIESRQILFLSGIVRDEIDKLPDELLAFIPMFLRQTALGWIQRN